MSRFPLPQGGGREAARVIKQVEAEDRNAKTPHKRTRAHRERRCSCKRKVK